MNFHHQEAPLENGQSPGCDPKTSKRNSGLFSFFKWFKPSVSRESIDSDALNSHSSSCESINSVQSNGTIASFSYVPPSAYNSGSVAEKCIAVGPETDTYRARLKQRDKRRENDKNLTLRKKYNLFFNRDTLLKTVPKQTEDENTKSLPLMTRTASMELAEEKIHRRTNSESSKIKRAGAYLHVKGKRRAPQPPGHRDNSSTSSLRRKKRSAPSPPTINAEKIIDKLEEVANYDTIKYADGDIIFNDSLKLDHGILKPLKESDTAKTKSDQDLSADATNSPNTSARSSYVDPPVSPRPWYKRNSNRNSLLSKKDKDHLKSDHKYEVIERLPEVPFMRNSTIDLTTIEETKIDKKKDEKRKSGLTFLTNISELDREACEIIKKEHMKNGNDAHQEMPEFMRPKPDTSKINSDSWVSPKRRSAKDLIAKFNAITNVTKVTVNSAFFGSSQKEKRDYFGRHASLSENKKQEVLLENHRKRLEKIDNKINEVKSNNPLAKSESASAIKNVKPETPKSERKTWNCPKCGLPNEYWRIICYVCSSIKPYFDDLTSQPSKSSESGDIKHVATKVNNSPPFGNNPDRILERSKTQIGFSALANYNLNQNKNKLQQSVSEDKSSKVVDTKKEEREKLKKMLIEMKNSLPKRKSNVLAKQTSRTSVILENPENSENETTKISEQVANKTEQKKTNAKKPDQETEECAKTKEKHEKEQIPEWKVAEIVIGTSETVYENIKVKKAESTKPTKVSASAQTSSVVKKLAPHSNMSEFLKEDQKMKNNFELMKPKDFEDIYSDTNAKSAARIYANLARNDELSLFFNFPKSMNDFGKHLGQEALVNTNTDTIEINRLLRRLETSISKGELNEASIYAKELAQLKVNCSVIRQKPAKDLKKEKGFSIEMYVEDKVSHRGPFALQVAENQTLEELKKQVEREFEIPVNVQRWILGKELATNDKAVLKDYNITTAGCPVFLYLVAPENKPGSSEPKPPVTGTSALQAKLGKKSSPELSPNMKNEAVKTKETPNLPNKNVSNIPSINEAQKIQKPETGINTTKCEETKSENTKCSSSAPKVVSVIPKVVESISKEQLKLGPKFQKLSIIKPEKVEIIKQHSVEVKPVIVDVSGKVIPDRKQVLITTTDNIERLVTNNNILTQNKLKEDNKKLQTLSVDAPLVKTIPIQIEERNDSKIGTEANAPERKQARAQVSDKSKILATSNNITIQNKLKPDPKISGDMAAGPVVTTIAVHIEERKNETKIHTETNYKSDKSVKSSITEEEEYDTNTLKPQKEWECHLCTLLNPVSSNICAVCATVRLKSNLKGKKPLKKKAPQPKENTGNRENMKDKEETYQQLVNLDNADLVENTETFECVICFLDIPPGQGATLRECLHQFCKTCLAQTVEYTEEAEVKCPYRDDQYSCNIALQDREVKALVTRVVYEKFLAKSVTQAENKIGKSFHCKSPDCRGWCIFEDNVNEFRCPVCHKLNCLTCQAIHANMNCKQYQEKMKAESEVDDNARRTKEMLEEMVTKGEAIACPTCQVILMKKWGCDWLRCSMCKTEICWVTRGPRWGPAGKGDTSGGCQCGVNGVKCHPQCNYCH